MANPNISYRSHQFGDTTLTKVFVGGLAWETPTDEMRAYFEQFGEIIEAVIIIDNNTGKSKGYGFVTFREAESARRACANPNPVIDGRRANCNIAALGRIQSGSGPSQQGAYSGVPAVTLPPPLFPPLIYQPYGHSTYTSDNGYQQAVYNPQAQVQQPQYYNQMYGTSSVNSPTGTPYFYGYSLQAPRATFSAARAHPMTRPSYIYYPTQMEGSLAFPPILQNPTFIRPQYYFPSPTTNSDSQTEQHASKEIEDEGTSDTDYQNN